MATVGNRDLSVAATLEKPIALLGLHAQYLGVVQRCSVLLDAGRITALELQTEWQTIQLDSSAVEYDADKEVFRMVRSDPLP